MGVNPVHVLAIFMSLEATSQKRCGYQFNSLPSVDFGSKKKCFGAITIFHEIEWVN